MDYPIFKVHYHFSRGKIPNTEKICLRVTVHLGLLFFYGGGDCYLLPLYEMSSFLLIISRNMPIFQWLICSYPVLELVQFIT